jgi:hypothetical protein
MEKAQWAEMVRAIAAREGTVRELAERFETTPEELRAFTTKHLEAIKAAKEKLDNPPPPSDEPTPDELKGLWISNKYERLKRMQTIAEAAYEILTDNAAGMTPAEYATAMRELRSYMMLAANELGQLMHRGSGESGEGNVLSVEIGGVDMDSLR